MEYNINDKVEHEDYGKGIVIDTNSGGTYSLAVDFGNDNRVYFTRDGYEFEYHKDKYPRLIKY